MTRETENIVGEFLAKRRAKAGRTQKEIADHAGKHVQYVCNIEKGYAPASAPVIVAYAELCKIPKNDILKAILEERKDWARKNVLMQIGGR